MYGQGVSHLIKRVGFLDSLGLMLRAAIVKPIWVRFYLHWGG